MQGERHQLLEKREVPVQFARDRVRFGHLLERLFRGRQTSRRGQRPIVKQIIGAQELPNMA
jgi:hypothetical protein